MTYDILNIDCFSQNGFPSIKNESIQMIIGDIPFNVTKNKWDQKRFDIPLMFSECYRVLKPKGTLCLFSMQPLTTYLINFQLDYFRYELVWLKEKGTQFFECNNRPLPAHEMILIFSKEYPNDCYPQKTIGKSYKKKLSSQSSNYGLSKNIITDNKGDRFPLSYIYCPRDFQNQGIHTTQKPVNLIRYLIRTYSRINNLILDFCMGSGSTIIGSLIEERDSIGFEIDSEMFIKTKNRIESFIQYGEDIKVKKQKPIMINQTTFDSLIEKR